MCCLAGDERAEGNHGVTEHGPEPGTRVVIANIVEDGPMLGAKQPGVDRMMDADRLGAEGHEVAADREVVVHVCVSPVLWWIAAITFLYDHIMPERGDAHIVQTAYSRGRTSYEVVRKP